MCMPYLFFCIIISCSVDAASSSSLGSLSLSCGSSDSLSTDDDSCGHRYIATLDMAKLIAYDQCDKPLYRFTKTVSPSHVISIAGTLYRREAIAYCEDQKSQPLDSKVSIDQPAYEQVAIHPAALIAAQLCQYVPLLDAEKGAGSWQHKHDIAYSHVRLLVQKRKNGCKSMVSYVLDGYPKQWQVACCFQHEIVVPDIDTPRVLTEIDGVHTGGTVGVAQDGKARVVVDQSGWCRKLARCTYQFDMLPIVLLTQHAQKLQQTPLSERETEQLWQAAGRLHKKIQTFEYGEHTMRVYSLCKDIAGMKVLSTGVCQRFGQIFKQALTVHLDQHALCMVS